MALKRITPGLSDTTLVTTIKRDYKDIDLSFANKRGTVFEDGARRGDVYKKLDVKSIDQSIQNILLTNKGERPFDPKFGSNLRRLLFGLSTEISESEITDTIVRAITKYEPRVKVLDVEVFDQGIEREVPKGISDVFFYSSAGNLDASRYSLTITVYCRILNTGQDIQTQVNMNRLR